MTQSVLERLRRVEVEGIELDEAVELSALGKAVVTEYQAQGIPVPEWLKDATDKLHSNIAQRQREGRLRRLRELEIEEQALLTRDERKAANRREKEALEAQLGVGKATAAPVPTP